MAIVFEGEVKVMINRHRFMGDGIVLTWPEFLIFSNTGNKYTLQAKQGFNIPFKTDYETVADAFLAAQVHLGKLKVEGDEYIPV